jgi:hypothetical protein
MGGVGGRGENARQHPTDAVLTRIQAIDEFRCGTKVIAQRAPIKTEKGLACLLSADTGTDLCR